MTDLIERRTSGMAQDELSDAIFSGRIIFFEQLPCVRALVAAAQRIVECTFDDADPLSAHTRISPRDYEARYATARKAFSADVDAVRSLETALTECGLEGDLCYRDRLVLRVSPPDARNYKRGFGAIPPHRDSWGSGIRSQINWWLPIYPLTADNTMAIFPAHWSKPVENDSDGWDWTRAGKDPGTPLLPTAQKGPDRSGEVRLDIAPGTIAAFSGAHLHASVPNTTLHARFSCETRTVSERDLHLKRGAPNIDGGDVPPALEWFRRLGDGKKLLPPDVREKPALAR